MSDEEEKNIESSTSSDKTSLEEELEVLKTQNSIMRELRNYEETPFFRMALIQELRTTNEELMRISQGLDSMAKKISNQNKILAAKLGVEIE